MIKRRRTMRQREQKVRRRAYKRDVRKKREKRREKRGFGKVGTSV